jgi:hypothetical protein
MQTSITKKLIILLIHAFTGWALCGATMMIGMQVTSEQTALVVHAIAAPIFFGTISWVYFSRFNYTTPLQTSLIFTAFVILMDFFVVALLIEKKFDMFTSLLGTWIPFALIFLSTYMVGLMISPARKETIRM